MKKLEVRICKCGRIHFYSSELLDKLLEEEKELVLVCSRCGHTIHIGADVESAMFFDEDADPEDIAYNMYAYSLENEEFDAKNFDKEAMKKEGKRTIGKIIIDEGIGVMMDTGYMADYYGSNGFADYGSNFDRMKKYKSLSELESDLDDYDKQRHQVCMKALLRNLTDDQAETLSCYFIKNLNWSETKYENSWNGEINKNLD